MSWEGKIVLELLQEKRRGILSCEYEWSFYDKPSFHEFFIVSNWKYVVALKSISFYVLFLFLSRGFTGFWGHAWGEEAFVFLPTCRLVDEIPLGESSQNKVTSPQQQH